MATEQVGVQFRQFGYKDYGIVLYDINTSTRDYSSYLITSYIWYDMLHTGIIVLYYEYHYYINTISSTAATSSTSASTTSSSSTSTCLLYTSPSPRD